MKPHSDKSADARNVYLNESYEALNSRRSPPLRETKMGRPH